MAKGRDNHAEKRKFPRTGVIWPGAFKTDRETVACTVLNLSANGAKLGLHTPLTANTRSGTLVIPRLGSFRAKIAWRAPKGGNEIGLTFEAPPADVAKMLAGALPKSRAASVS